VSTATLLQPGTIADRVVDTERVHVLYFITGMQIGGSELNALRTAERLDRSRFAVTVATLATDGPLLHRFRDAGIRVVSFPITSLYNRSALQQGLKLYSMLRRERVAVLHCHDLYSNVFALPWGRLARVPASIASRRWIHPIDEAHLEVANRLAYRFAHRVLGNSTAVVELLQQGDGVKARRIMRVPNFVDDRAFTPMPPAAVATFRSELGIPADALVAGCIARLVGVKDHATLLRAVARVRLERPVHLVLVGDGDRRDQLVALAAELGIANRVHFAGYRPNLPNLNQAFDVAVLASRSEGFSNSVVEAMAAGRAVVATGVGGNADAVSATTGFLVPPAEPGAFAAALQRVLGDEPLRRRMGSAALAVARSEFHAAAVVPALEASYLALIGSRGSGVA
jgi:glycosyltransferase involved in cell wall biosynthesis